MSGLALDEAVLARAFDYLRSTEPFRRWGLPEASAIRFKVARSRLWYGQCFHDGKAYGVDISAALVSHSNTLLSVMAHEMIHLRQMVAGTQTRGASHNKEFHPAVGSRLRRPRLRPQSLLVLTIFGSGRLGRFRSPKTMLTVGVLQDIGVFAHGIFAFNRLLCCRIGRRAQTAGNRSRAPARRKRKIAQQ